MQSIVEDGRITKQYEEQMEAKASRYLKRYRPYIEMLESRSLISKIRTISPYDVYALGRTLEQWEEYHKMVEDDGTLAQLGRIPNVAFDNMMSNELN